MNCLLEWRNVFTVMPTGFGESFISQLFPTAIEQNKNSEGKHPNSVILVICPLIGLIEDQIKEGQSLGLTCASLQDVNIFLATILCHNFYLYHLQGVNLRTFFFQQICSTKLNNGIYNAQNSQQTCA